MQKAVESTTWCRQPLICVRLFACYIVQCLHVGCFTATLCNGGSVAPVKLPLFGHMGALQCRCLCGARAIARFSIYIKETNLSCVYKTCSCIEIYSVPSTVSVLT